MNIQFPNFVGFQECQENKHYAITSCKLQSIKNGHKWTINTILCEINKYSVNNCLWPSIHVYANCTCSDFHVRQSCIKLSPNFTFENKPAMLAIPVIAPSDTNKILDEQLGMWLQLKVHLSVATSMKTALTYGV